MQQRMTYQEALDYLYGFMDYDRKPAATAAEAALNLTRMRALLADLGDPQCDLCSVVVAGTKGKGSTCAMIESIVRAAGYRTGLWTSPHLNSYRERIQVDRQLISAEELIRLVEWLRPAVENFNVATYG
ncbi:MAG: bifunctional folylpolyglutamate synthase/dihydrofolate synthase, partial [Chloroflexales bacterium]|nr:bifunctional folylpolyglutamate synthase/dihydrofolate synthase [Chloroflexales bacterium]